MGSWIVGSCTTNGAGTTPNTDCDVREIKRRKENKNGREKKSAFFCGSGMRRGVGAGVPGVRRTAALTSSFAPSKPYKTAGRLPACAAPRSCRCPGRLRGWVAALPLAGLATSCIEKSANVVSALPALCKPGGSEGWSVGGGRTTPPCWGSAVRARGGRGRFLVLPSGERERREVCGDGHLWYTGRARGLGANMRLAAAAAAAAGAGARRSSGKISALICKLVEEDDVVFL